LLLPCAEFKYKYVSISVRWFSFWEQRWKNIRKPNQGDLELQAEFDN
jgi:hypothetical protein